MNQSCVTVRVSSIRSQNPVGRGGAIFTGVEVDSQGQRLDAKSHYVIKAPHHLLLTSVEIGQLWRVTGQAQDNTIMVNGYRLTEATITPESMELLRPSGEHIITLLAEGEAFEGIGLVKARRLWDHFGEALYRILDTAEVESLAEVLPLAMAKKLADAWQRWGDTFTLQWLQSKGFSVSLGRKVVTYFGPAAAQAIEEDPYRLISFAATWATTDALARQAFGITEDDPRRLAGAIEEALYAAFDAGHTCLAKSAFVRRLTLVLGGQGSALAQGALAEAAARGRLVERMGLLHAPGPYVMECTVAQDLAVRSLRRDTLLDPQALSQLLRGYAEEAGITLHERQIEALQLTNARPVAVITGGAGTGKTTVLRGLIRMAAEAGWPVYAMALSGRAAKRISEATGHAAQTIAGFLNRFDPDDAPRQAMVIVDEASMLDLPSAYRLIRRLPSAYRLVLVGDPHQLAPVGPGLLLHELTRQNGIALVELTQVKRYGGRIAEAAAAIRQGQWPDLPTDTEVPIAFVPCRLDQLNDNVLRLYEQDASSSQILCATRHSAAGGVKAINTLCQHRFNAQGQELLLWNHEFSQGQGSGLRVGDPVICLKNDWERNLQNGSIGTVLAVAPPVAEAEHNRVLGSVLWDDGVQRDLTRDLLPNLELAYAITIHKAQGSQFRRVIIPVSQSRLLDRTLLYTAVTRAEQQVILVGDVAAAHAAVEAKPHAQHRQVALGALFNETLEGLI